MIAMRAMRLNDADGVPVRPQNSSAGAAREAWLVRDAPTQSRCQRPLHACGDGVSEGAGTKLARATASQDHASSPHPALPASGEGAPSAGTAWQRDHGTICATLERNIALVPVAHSETLKIAHVPSPVRPAGGRARAGGGGADVHLPPRRCRRARDQDRAAGGRLRRALLRRLPSQTGERRCRQRLFRLAQPRQAIAGARPRARRRQGCARGHARQGRRVRAEPQARRASPSSAFRSTSCAARIRGSIICSISGYGEDGPYAARKAYDMLIQAESGLASLTGSPDAPARVGVSVCDIAAGMNAYEAILEALIARGRTGDGAAISISMFDAMADWMAVPLLQYEGGQPPRRIGPRAYLDRALRRVQDQGRRRHSHLDPERPRMARAGRAGARRRRARRRSRFRHQCRARQAPRRHRRARAGGVRRHRRRGADAEARRRRHRLCPRQRHRRRSPPHPQLRRIEVETPSGAVSYPAPRRAPRRRARAATARCPRSASTAPRSAPSSCRRRSA